jgi:hypothetical protein
MTEKIFEDDFELPPPPKHSDVSERVADEHRWSQERREVDPPSDKMYLDELEVKMAKLHVYWELLKTSLFADPTSLTDEVQEEVFDYVKAQVAVLMGQKKPKKGVKKASRKHLRSAVMRPATSWPASAVKKTITTQSVATKQSSDIENLFAPDDYVVESPTVDGQGKLERRYVKQVDTDSGKEYYLMAQRMLPGGKWMPDGNRYYKAQNEFGATVFRVINQQFKIIPTIGVAKTNAQFSADSMAHSLEVVQQQSKSNPIIASILGKVTGT